ncbi:MAG: prepilin-type N-terminal cleavage/methylation domain-containing protein [Elusimicrobiaceae bacterium]|nr:prepilin-type N-terminal cleavage/methylation domain-containing protein [Elusimicrobiaceae bacterium]
MKKTLLNTGFSLIELLAVLLVIAVLASFALFEYQKVIERSRAAEAISLLRSLYHAEKVYQMTYGKYAPSIESLSINFKGQKVNCTQNNNSPCWGYYNTEAIKGEKWSIELEKGKNPSISVGRISGPYAGTGFFMQLDRADGVQYPLEQLACLENGMGKFKYKKKEGSYCIDVMDGTFYSKSSSSRKYELPS